MARIIFFTILFLLVWWSWQPLGGQLGGREYRLMPNPQLTPGELSTQWTIDDICKNGTGKYRNVPISEKRVVAKKYGISYPSSQGAIEYDHFYSLGIGGSNEEKNLWPQPAPEFHLKDKVEAYLNRQVCSGKMNVEEAKRITDDWYNFYQKNLKGQLGGTDGE